MTPPQAPPEAFVKYGMSQWDGEPEDDDERRYRMQDVELWWECSEGTAWRAAINAARETVHERLGGNPYTTNPIVSGIGEILDAALSRLEGE